MVSSRGRFATVDAHAQGAHRATAAGNSLLRDHARDATQITETIRVAARTCTQIEDGGNRYPVRAQHARELVTLAVRREDGDALARRNAMTMQQALCGRA